MKKKIALICGGKSAEHEVSIRSARNIAAALNKDQFDSVIICISKEGSWYLYPNTDLLNKVDALVEKSIPKEAKPVALVSLKGKPVLLSLNDQSQIHLDCAFPILHGTMGEDGTIQGLFKLVNLPFVGCGVWASAAGMDKEIMKRLLKDANIPSARYKLLTPYQKYNFDNLQKELGLPFFIKPANAGSSVGVHKIKNKEDFETKIKDSFLFDEKVLAEEFVEGREIECSVMGHNHSAKASIAGEVIPTHEFYSYEAKYLDDNGAAIKIPAEISSEVLNKIQATAVKTFHVMGCEGLTRVDFFLKKNGDIIVNEINTLPGFTKISMYPKMWEASGIKYTDLITQLIQLAFEKFDSDQKLLMTYPKLDQ